MLFIVWKVEGNVIHSDARRASTACLLFLGECTWIMWFGHGKCRDPISEQNSNCSKIWLVYIVSAVVCNLMWKSLYVQHWFKTSCNCTWFRYPKVWVNVRICLTQRSVAISRSIWLNKCWTPSIHAWHTVHPSILPPCPGGAYKTAFPTETRVIFETQLGQSLVAVAKFLLPAKTTV